MTIVTTEAALEDVPEIAKLHRVAFPGYFLTHLGQDFLELFYAEFVTRGDSYCVVAADGNQVVGLVAGTANAKLHHRTFYRRNFIRVVRIVLTRFFKDAHVRREIGKRAIHIQIALEALLSRNKQKGSSQTDASGKSTVPSRLLSIAVHPDYRGQNIASELTSHFLRLLRNDGVSRVGLSVRSDNMSAIRFYEKDGWVVERVTPDSVYFFRNIEPSGSTTHQPGLDASRQ